MALLNADQLDTSPLEYTIKGVVPRLGTGFVHGASYTGKSLATLEMALAVANGTPWLGHETIQGCVAVALGEGVPGYGIRIKARLARQERDDRESGADPATIAPYTSERLFIMNTPFTLPLSQQNEPTDELRRAIGQLKVLPDLELLILDAFSDFGTLSISNDASANRYMLGLKYLVRELNCVVLVVAHNTADDKKMLGAERLFNASDFVLSVKLDDTAPEELKTATISCRKQKDGGEFEPISYRIHPLKWDELDNNGELVEVNTATVRLNTGENGGLRLPGVPRMPQPLPNVRDVPPRRKRSGVLSGNSAYVAGSAGLAADANASVAPELVKRLLASACPPADDDDFVSCGAVAGTTCVQPGVRQLTPELAAHPARMAVAVSAGRATLDEVLAVVNGPEPEAAPHVPKF